MPRASRYIEHIPIPSPILLPQCPRGAIKGQTPMKGSHSMASVAEPERPSPCPHWVVCMGGVDHSLLHSDSLPCPQRSCFSSRKAAKWIQKQLTSQRMGHILSPNNENEHSLCSTYLCHQLQGMEPQHQGNTGAEMMEHNASLLSMAKTL